MLGIVGGLIGCAVLAASVIPQGDPGRITAVGLYVLGLMAMLVCSALYHGTHDPIRKRRFRRYDHAAIFLMIAGTYTLLIWVVLGDQRGVMLLGFVWTVALLGMAIKLLAVPCREWLSVAIYLALGWTILAVPGDVAAALSNRGLILLAAGGVLYTVGVAFYAWERLRFHTVVWHACVLAAASCHYLTILSEIAG